MTVALTGDGGDENFAGYRRYYHDLMENRLRSCFADRLRTQAVGTLGRWYPKLDWAPRIFRAQATFHAFSRDPAAGYYYSVCGIKPEIRDQLLTRDLQVAVKGYDPFQMFHDLYHRAKTTDHLSRIQYLDIKTYLVDDILVKVDRASMANSLEVRCPLLDHKFMELIARIPSNLKLNKGRGKYIFKKALTSVLPSEVLQRRKQGFAVPLAEWFRGELKELSGDFLLTQDPLGVLDRRSVESLWRAHHTGRSDLSVPLWTILMYRLWQKSYLDATIQPVFQPEAAVGNG